jgi:hypothetical protein
MYIAKNGLQSAPSSQKAITTLVLGCFTKLRSLEPYIAHDDDGEPGMGRSPDADGERLDILK